jgi:phosphate-selective porin
MSMLRPPFARAGLAALTALAFSMPLHAQTTPSPEAALAQRVDRLQAELDALKAQLAQLQRERAGAQAAAPAAGASAPAAAAPTATATPTYAPIAPEQPVPTGEPATVLSSYGEINYNHYNHSSDRTQADLRRAVLGFAHRFDDKTRVVTEFEVEHAIASSSDSGEFEVEQAFIEHRFTPTYGLRAGLFLIPAGLLNENHEPTAYYGVERNFVETAIIPSTWREGGLQVFGTYGNGLTAQAGVSTGFDITKWDAASTEGAESPLGSIHQELQLAKARDLSVFGALNWRGIPGLQLGGSVFTGGANQGQPGVPDMRVTLWDLHARWTPGRWDLAAVYARGQISGTAEFNATLVGNPTLVPKTFDGWYAQAAYKVWSSGDYALTPFARYERYNTGRSYADLGPGLTPPARPTERVVTVGANFQLTPGVVFKADIQRFDVASENNRFDLGLGWSF